MNPRLLTLIDLFTRTFNNSPTSFFQSTGRMELIGNHTDHQGGTVLVAAIDMVMSTAVTTRDDNVIVLLSEGYPRIEISLDDLASRTYDFNRTSGIIRGVAYHMMKKGYKIGGLSIVMNSEVRPGSGVSSSAAIEVMIVKMLSSIYNDDSLDPVTIAKIAQLAENTHFGKPSGLLDQMGIALGGINYIDFTNENDPCHEAVPFPFDDLHFIIINTGGSHTDLTHHYAAVKDNMLQIAHHFGKNRLIDVNPLDLQRQLFDLVNRYGARVINRALHFFQECERVKLAKYALIRRDRTSFLAQVNASGLSSEQLLQNITFEGDSDPRLADGLAFCRANKGMGAIRVHGGGFAGTILAIMPNLDFQPFLNIVKQHFGENQVSEVSIIENGLTELPNPLL